ncbi:hypothetical protein LJR098_002562 [Rhizobium sp. LjRoot98]|uniref:hypothetical protein n=1 Tax=unclassified Rhizobium TaxID=2613769 RepID=UPI000714C06F|nr:MULTISPECIES: hypothetical protein [unclassified Rhizobium]KQV31249.1 hypothetical protein ASC96_08680 [Rhizobium sp. Root1204]KQY10800.1 hypothetical protein ASD36_08780 [Rhizobium sp. Root1334]KRC04785.1 hypothetical protein ASE23_06545 [Rhizobium sp. Root73]
MENNGADDKGLTAKASVKERIKATWNGTANVCGVLALIISVSWTFPSELWRAYFSSQLEMEEGLKVAIGEMTRVYKEFAQSQSSIGGQSGIMMTTISQVQISYQLDKIGRYPDYVLNGSSYLENLTLAQMATVIGKFDDGQRFYKSALVAADRENLEPQEVYIGLAANTLGRDGITGILKAREHYRNALTVAWKRYNTGRADYALAPLGVLLEISLAELKYGSWDCGNTVSGFVEQQLSRPEMLAVPALQNYLAVYRATKAATVKTSGRPEIVCNYLLPA